MSDLKIAVVGAGVIGVTTATELQKRYRNAKIEIIADKFYEDTTSWVAAGIFRPSENFGGVSEEIARKWMLDSYNYWEDIRTSREGAKAGVTETSGYFFSNKYPEIVRNRLLEKICPVFRPATKEELNLCPGEWKYGSFLTTLVAQSTFYIPWAVDTFVAKGGKLVNDKILSLDKLALKYDAVVNCSGLGARFLCNDYNVVPIRGQVIKVKAPWIKTFFYVDYDTYIIPGIDSITLGGCRQYESWDLNVCKYDGLKIKEACETLVPSLKNAELIGHKVGLRPHRSIVRVEKERKNVDGKVVKIVHNYGHGGYGVTAAPGTSLQACDLVQEILSGNSKL